MKEILIIKLGGSLITYKNSKIPKINKDIINRLSNEISGYNEDIGLIIVHGAGSFGHPLSKKYKLNDNSNNEMNKLIFSKVQILQNKLNSIVCNCLLTNHVPAFPFQVSTYVYFNNGIVERFDTLLIEKLLIKGIVPVLFGTPVYDEKKSSNIFSGDDIIFNLIKNTNLVVKDLIFATDVDGIFDKDPNIFKDAKLIKKINSLEGLDLSGSSNIDVTGGMKNKIEKIFSLGINFRIINGNKIGELKKAINGEDVGTLIIPN
jgi:isopentenyl phosphate kinase